jgi:predicted HNH restriction endonuclease
MPGKFETLFAYKFDNCTKVEQTIHHILNRKRENGEWFVVNEYELEHIKATCELMEGILVTDEVNNEIENEILTENVENVEIKIEAKINNDFKLEYDNTNEVFCITSKDILKMKKGDLLSNLYMLIVNSKNPNSENWAGEEFIIHNTPQKGINWIGNYKKPFAVIIKTQKGKYAEDSEGQYAFEATKGYVNKNIKSNQVIINQKVHNYPIFHFVQSGSKYILTGIYSVDKIFDKYVTLIPYDEK